MKKLFILLSMVLAYAYSFAQDQNNQLPCLPSHGGDEDVSAWCDEEIVTQTISLSTGSNYCSFNVEITLDELKAALVEAFPNSAISIKSKNQTHTYNPNNHRWSGTFNTFDISKMNIIKVDNDGEITLQGYPVNPAYHPVTISIGSNYISFPFNANMTPTQAFAEFAIDGDKIKSKTNTIIYNRGRWSNQIPTLEPGKGYIYISNSTETRTFTYPTNAK